MAIADGAIVGETQRMAGRQGVFGVVVYDVATGAELWHRDGVVPVAGTPLFLEDGPALVRVAVRTGTILWRSAPLCPQQTQHPSYVKAAGASAYVGCDGGALYRLNAADGRVLASAQGLDVDNYRQMEMLSSGRLVVAGYASIGMFARSAILNARSLATIGPKPRFTADLEILGIHDGEAIAADVCCRGMPDTNAPGSILGLSMKDGSVLWSVAIRPYHPALPLSDVEPGAGVFALAGSHVYAGTRTALFRYDLGELRTNGSKASRREIYSGLAGTPDLYDGRYLLLFEGTRTTVRRSILFDTATQRELWSDGRRPWSAPPPQLQTGSVVEMYSVTPAKRRFALLRLRDGRMLPIDTGCYLQAANERYAVALCGRRGAAVQLALFDLNSAHAAVTSPSPVSATATPAPRSTNTSLLSRWTQHEWALIGSTTDAYFFGRRTDGIVAVDRRSGAAVWQNRSVCSAVSVARVIAGVLYVGCPDMVAALDRSTGRVRRTQPVGIYGFNDIAAAGENAIVAEGWNDGAALSNNMAILDRKTLRPISRKDMTDSTFLGVIGERAYIDDWCCFGRPDEYRPATIYSISLKDGSATKPVDLAPDPNLHPPRMQPLGQGEHNYLDGHDFYVVTPNYTYRYDVRNLHEPPVRTVTPGNSPAPR